MKLFFVQIPRRLTECAMSKKRRVAVTGVRRMDNYFDSSGSSSVSSSIENDESEVNQATRHDMIDNRAGHSYCDGSYYSLGSISKMDES